MGESKKIVVAGLVCLDITPQWRIDTKFDMHACLQPGKLIRTKGVTISAGGAVANTGLGLAKLGANVHLMYMVGEDSFGDLIKQEMDACGVPSTCVITKEEATGYSMVIAVPGYDRILLHDVGANDIMTSDVFDYSVIQDASLFHFGYPQSMRQFYLEDAAELVKMYRRVHGMGVATSLDMALADSSSESGRVNWRKVIQNVLPYVDFFEPSLEELYCSMDRENYEKLNEEARKQGKEILELLPREEIQSMADQLIDWGGRVILIKCGSQGMYLRTASQERLDQIGGDLAKNLQGWGNQKIWMPCFRVDMVRSGTGAGDTSIAGFLYAMQRGFPVERCVELAAATGAICVTSYDALSAIVPLDEINAKIEAGWEKRS